MPPDLRIRALGQIAQPVVDLARATAFYRGVLGLEFLLDVPRMAFFRLGDTRLMLAASEDEPRASGTILYLSVDDLESSCEGLEGRGVELDQDPTLVADMGDHELWMAFFKDSEGNQLALMAEKAKS